MNVKANVSYGTDRVVSAVKPRRGTVLCNFCVAQTLSGRGQHAPNQFCRRRYRFKLADFRQVQQVG